MTATQPRPPILVIGDVHGKLSRYHNLIQNKQPHQSIQLGDFDPTVSTGSPDGTGFPRSIFNVRYEPDFFDSSVGGSRMTHPTQKPASLMEYLIRTYTNEGETVLDNCMGSGATGVAAMRCNRRFIGIERDLDYFTAASERIAKAARALELSFA